MEVVQTITVNGQTYRISDPNAATKEDIGDISAALDSIIALQQTYIDSGGDAQ